MMKAFAVFVLLVATHPLCLLGQDSTRYHSRWQTNLAFGSYMPLTTLLKNTDTDYLLEFDDRTSYIQLINAAYFFRRHWGIEFNFQFSSSSGMQKRDERFQQLMQSRYEYNYYVEPSFSTQTLASNYFSDKVERSYLGLIYRLEYKRFFIYPKFSLGFTSFKIDRGIAFLKEKNSNQVLKVTYAPNERVKDFGTVALSAKLGYKLSKRIYFNIDFLLAHFKTDITITKTTTDLNTEEFQEEKTDYKKNIFTMSLGAGLVFVLK